MFCVWRLLSPLLGGLVVVLVSAAGWAGEGVTFSDRRSEPRPAVTSRPASRGLGLDKPLGSFDPGASSLQGITAPPFATPNAIPLTPRERELLIQRRDWILQSPDNRLGSSEEVNRAFGVRDYKPESSGKDNDKEKEKGTLSRYYEKLEAAEEAQSSVKPQDQERSTPDNNNNADSLSPFGVERTPQDFWGGGGYLGPSDRSSGDSMSPRLGDFSSGFRSDSLGMAARDANRWPKPFEADRSSGRKSSFSFQTLGGAEAANQPTAAERLLGSNPVGNPIGRDPISSLDPVTAYPDPTRQALNPVVSSPVGSLGSPLQAASPGRDRPLASSPSSVMRDLGGGSFRGAFSPNGASPVFNERRTLNSMKVTLEAPRRGF